MNWDWVKYVIIGAGVIFVTTFANLYQTNKELGTTVAELSAAKTDLEQQLAHTKSAKEDNRDYLLGRHKDIYNLMRGADEASMKIIDYYATQCIVQATDIAKVTNMYRDWKEVHDDAVEQVRGINAQMSSLTIE